MATARLHFLSWALAPCLSTLAAAVVPAQQTFLLGGEFQVNAFTTSSQAIPAIALNDAGDFVVTWQSEQQDGAAYGVFARRFDAAGAPQGAELQVNTYTPNNQTRPAVALGAQGDFVLAWASTQFSASHDTFARRFDSTGAPGAVLQANTYTQGAQAYPAIGMDGGGGFVIAWESFRQDDNDDIAPSWGIFARRFDSTGAAQGVAFQVNVHTLGDQRSPALAMEPGGDFVVAWRSLDQDGSGSGVFARTFDASGAAQGGELQVNAFTLGAQAYPSLVVGDGDFVVAWQSFGQDGNGYGVFARRFASTGSALTSEFQINSITSGAEARPAAALKGARFLVVWEGYETGNYPTAIFGRRFDHTGAPLGAEFQVDSSTLGFESAPAVAMASGGRFVVSWTSFGQDGSGNGIFAQRLVTLALLDADGNGITGALTDGLLLLRSLFGFTGSALVSGAVGAGCVRCTSGEIEAYLGAAPAIRDIDGDHLTNPLTDGLLALRFLFGFTGTTLTSGAVGDDCTRCDSFEIETYLERLL